MSQQVFADFLGQSPATLSSIFNGRTRPTLNVVDAIKAKIPDISIEWLLYGTGEMHISHSGIVEHPSQDGSGSEMEPMLNFDTPASEVLQTRFSGGSTLGQQNMGGGSPFAQQNLKGVKKSPQFELSYDDLRIEEKAPRKVTEIRVYYDDQTYETFVPAKKL